MFVVRGMLCVWQTLVSVLLRRVDDEIKVEVIHWAAYYDHRMHLGSKPIFHLEAFIARFMAMSPHTRTRIHTTQHSTVPLTAHPCCYLLLDVLCVCSYKKFIVESFG